MSEQIPVSSAPEMETEIRALAEALVTGAREKGLRIGVAESCTGGLIAAAITEVPGSSAVFAGGVVAYENSVKAGLLGVQWELLASEGAVSAPVAEAMAHGARRLLDVDIAVAVTGIAGPSGGTPEKPVGLVFAAAAMRAQDEARDGERISAERYRFSGSRGEIRRATVRAALGLLVGAARTMIPPKAGPGGT